jgi:hypothetical protein
MHGPMNVKCLSNSQRQAQKLISGPSPAAKTRLLSVNKIKSMVVTGLLTERNNLYIMGLIDSPL